jgi:lauroyl/myristoyl acyltransferase
MKNLRLVRHASGQFQDWQRNVVIVAHRFRSIWEAIRRGFWKRDPESYPVEAPSLKTVPREAPRPPVAKRTDKPFATRTGERAARVMGWAARIIPLRVGYWFSDRAGNLLYWRSLRYRRNVVDNLRHVHRGAIDEERLREQSINVFQVSCRNFWDLARAPYYQMDDLSKMIRFDSGSWEILDRVKAEGKGGVLLSAHLGAFDFVGQYIVRTRYDPLILTSPTVSEVVFAGVTYWRSRTGGRVERTSAGSLRRIVKALRNGEFVGLVSDRDFSVDGSGVPVMFFGKETTLPGGPARLARDTGAPLIPLFAIRDDNRSPDRYLFHIVEPMYVEKTDDVHEDVRRGVQQMARVLEHYISLAPEQWVMFQKVWNQPSATRGRGVSGFRRAGRPGPAESNGSGEIAGGLPDLPDRSDPGKPANPEQQPTGRTDSRPE